ncbi:MAG: hypothetical protein M1830_002812 [Pleopsidium flavum]|nr:MAG: hypothetical protein M1830_002812 [Pleopsidium flavum]
MTGGDSSHQVIFNSPLDIHPSDWTLAAANVPLLRKRSPATVAAKPDTSLATALTRPLPELVAPVVEQADTLVVVVVAVAVARSATSVARSVISHVTAPKAAALMVEVIKATRADMVVGMVVDAKVVRLATLAADMDTCRVTAHKGRNATTVAKLVT